MCLILFQYKTHPTYPLILAANRDEFHQRETAPLSFWADTPDILAGRDLKGGGTWLGLSKKGRLAAITNYRDLRNVKPNAPSRGELIPRFLTGPQTALEYLHELQKRGTAYEGFNLLLGDATGLFYFSNQGREILTVTPGIHGLSNRFLDTPWPKVNKGIQKLKALTLNTDSPSPDALFDLLTDEAKPPDHQLPDTGVGLEWERILSSMFIRSPYYGTRSSALVLIDQEGRAQFWEKTYVPPTSETLIFQLSSFKIE